MAVPHPALIDLAAGRSVPPVEDVARLVASAVEHKMQGLLWLEAETGRLVLPRAAELALASGQLRTRARHDRLWRSLVEATKSLEAVGIKVAAAKGVTAEARWYPNMGSRPSRDVDLFLRPSDMPRVSEALITLQPDHPFRDRIFHLVRAGHLQSVDVVDDEGTQIDLHFDILKCEVETWQSQTIWDRVVSIGTPVGGEVLAMDAETSLILFLLHLNKDRFSYLLGFADVARLVQQEELDWDFIDSFLRTEGLATHAYMALESVYRALGVKAPEHPVQRGWRACLWRLLWPESIQLQGHKGLLSHHRRQFWISVMARGRFLEGVSRWLRRLVPPRDLVDYYFPKVGGSYFAHLLRGRLGAANGRRAILSRLEDGISP